MLGGESYPARRRHDRSATGFTTRQLFINVAGGLILATIVGVIVSYGAQQVLVERLDNLAEKLESMGRDLEQIRRDIYAPRYRSDAATGVSAPMSRVGILPPRSSLAALAERCPP